VKALPRRTRNVQEVVPFLWVRSMKRSLRYYVDGLGFRLAQRWTVDGTIRWCRLELGGAALMLQELAKRRRPEGKLGEGVSVCFICKDALALHAGFKARRLAASEPEVGNAMWYTTLLDPDGYRILFESATNVAEDTKLSEVLMGPAAGPRKARPKRAARDEARRGGSAAAESLPLALRSTAPVGPSRSAEATPSAAAALVRRRPARRGGASRRGSLDG